MATTRIKDITTAASTFSSDDFVAIDGATSGTRKMAKADLISEVSSGVSGTYLEESNNLSDVASLDTSKLNMEIPDVGSAANEVSLNGMLGDMAFQSSDGVSMGTVSADEIGVGVSDPSAKIDIATAINTNGLFIRDDSDNSITHNLYIDGSGNSQTTLYADGQAAKINLNTAGSTYFTGGRVGIGTATPENYYGASDDLVVSGDSNRGISIISGSTSSSSIAFGSGTGTDAYRGKITYDNNSHSLAFNTLSATRWTINSSGNLVSSGGAIDFGSGATLSDYEEGVHTTTAVPDTSGSITLDTAYDRLAYTKIGRSIIVTGSIKVSSVSSPVGPYVRITLPTSTLDLDDKSGAIGGGVAHNNGTSWGPISCAAGESSNVLYLHIDASTVSTNDQFRFSLCYQSA